MYYYEPVNLLTWDMFKSVSGKGHIESFYAVKSMQPGDIVLLHVGSQVKEYESGVYAVGKVIYGPYTNEIQPDGLLDNRLRVNLEITRIDYSAPIIPHEVCKEFIPQFRTVQQINPTYYPQIEEFLK